MTPENLTQRWRGHLFRILERPEVGKPLQAAARAGKLATWTSELTSAVVETCASLQSLCPASRYNENEIPGTLCRCPQAHEGHALWRLIPNHRIEGPTPNGGAYAIAYEHDDGSVEIVEFDSQDRAIHRTYAMAKQASR